MELAKHSNTNWHHSQPKTNQNFTMIISCNVEQSSMGHFFSMTTLPLITTGERKQRLITSHTGLTSIIYETVHPKPSSLLHYTAHQHITFVTQVHNMR